MTTSGKQKKSDAGLSTGAAGPKDRMTVAQFEALPVEDKIRLVRSVAGTLDPGCARHQDMADTVVVEQDSALSGGLPIAYFFRDPAHLAAARWDARQEMTDVDLEELDDEVELDDVDAIFSGQLAGENTIFEGSVTELLRGKDGTDVRASWRENPLGSPLSDEVEQRRFLHFIRTGETPEDEDVDRKPNKSARKRRGQGGQAVPVSRSAKPGPATGYFCEQCDAFHETEEIPDRQDAWLCEGEDGVTSNDICEHYEEGVLECEHEMTDAWELPCECLVADEPEIKEYLRCAKCGAVHKTTDRSSDCGQK